MGIRIGRHEVTVIPLFGKCTYGTKHLLPNKGVREVGQSLLSVVISPEFFAYAVRTITLLVHTGLVAHPVWLIVVLRDVSS